MESLKATIKNQADMIASLQQTVAELTTQLEAMVTFLSFSAYAENQPMCDMNDSRLN